MSADTTDQPHRKRGPRPRPEPPPPEPRPTDPNVIAAIFSDDTLRDLLDAEAKVRAAELIVEDKRRAVAANILARLQAAGITASQFCNYTGLHRGNFYDLIGNRKWNTTLMVQALDMLSLPVTATRDPEVTDPKHTPPDATP